MDDSQIIELYWARSESAIAETDRKYGPYCRTIARNILHSDEDAEECVNDAYLGVWNAIPPQRPTFFAAFIGKITRNLSLHRYQKNHAAKRGGGETGLLLSELEGCLDSPGSLDETMDSRSVGELLDRFLEGLPKEHRVIFVRRYWYADPIADIALRMNMGQSRVTSILFRTRNKLQKFLEKEGVSI